MKWQQVKNQQEWRLYRNPFTFWIFLEDDYAHCIVHFGQTSDDTVITGKDGVSHLDAGKGWCIKWAIQKLKELNEDFANYDH